jgi:hypothetical protein
VEFFGDGENKKEETEAGRKGGGIFFAAHEEEKSGAKHIKVHWEHSNVAAPPINSTWRALQSQTTRGYATVIPPLDSQVSTACWPLQQNRQILWIAGPPGAGKTTVTKRFQQYGFMALDVEDEWARGGSRMDKLYQATLKAKRTLETAIVFAAGHEAWLADLVDPPVKPEYTGVTPIMLLPDFKLYTSRWKTRQEESYFYAGDHQPHEERWHNAEGIASGRKNILTPFEQQPRIGKSPQLITRTMR